jgi:Contractile injection system tube protein/LysM domain
MAKATIVKLNKKGEKSDQVEVLFNPKELTFSKTNNWKQDPSPKANMPATEFTSGGPRTLKLQLYFDTYKDAKNGKAEDVCKKYTDKIFGMMQVDPEWKDKKHKKGRPPNVRFLWGTMVGFEAVITSVNQRITLFLPVGGGTPVRAVLDVTFSEVTDPVAKENQNPTSGGIGGERLWTVREGETLSWIAFREYNDPNQWRVIADANRLTQVRRLRPGTTLVIPSV